MMPYGDQNSQFKSFKVKYKKKETFKGWDAKKPHPQKKTLLQHRPHQEEHKEKNEGKSSENQSFSWQDTESLIPIIRAVIFSASHDMLGSETANQCPGELFMPALSLIHLYYSDRWLQSSNGWTHRALKTVGAEAVQWEDHRQKSCSVTVSVQVHL